MNLLNPRVLAIMPHPDDIEILCAGTLLLLRERGCEIHVATMTAGDKGSASHSPTEISAIRREEARRASQVLGALSYNCLEFPDLEICFDAPSRRRVAGLLREVDPQLVFTTPPRDYMFDHQITSQLVRDACFNASVPNYSSDPPRAPGSGVPYLYYSDALEGHDLFGHASPVSVWVDVSGTIDEKARALECHESQRAWLQKQHGMDDYIANMKAWGAHRGREIGVSFAEAFCQHLGHPHPQNDVLAFLLGKRARTARAVSSTK